MNQLYILLLALWSAFNTSSFLIYNEDHKKCVYAVSATVVQAASCDVSSKAQHFRWISSSQIISLSFNLCLGSEKINDWVKIILLPCNDLSSVQAWECKNGTLFGLKGHPLHLNYGNHDEPNVMLFSGTGVWSHWQIYGTKENLCSCGYKAVWTLILTAPIHCRGSIGIYKVVIHIGNASSLLSLMTSALDHHEEGVSLFYICFSSFIVVGLFIMTAAVIVTNIRSKAKGNTGHTMTFTSKEHENA